MVLDTVSTDRGNHGRKPAFSDGQRGGFLNRSDDPNRRSVAGSCAVPSLRTRLQGWQIIVCEAFQCFLVGAAGISTTVETTMLIKSGKELLGSGLRGGVGGSSDLLPRHWNRTQ